MAFRKHMQADFQRIYHFDLKGNARTSGERRRREGGNVFSDKIRVGVGISILVRNKRARQHRVCYHAVPDYWRAHEKQSHLASYANLSAVPWTRLKPDARNTWLVPENGKEFEAFVSLGRRERTGAARGRIGSHLHDVFNWCQD